MTSPVLVPRPKTVRLTGGFHRAAPGPTALEDSAIARVDPGVFARPEGYRLVVAPDAVRIEAHDPAGAFYATRTVRQLRRFSEASRSAVPCLEIEDWPDFPRRGMMLDISRDKVPTLSTLRDLIDLFAELKVNEIQLYTEHTFAYPDHPEVWRRASPLDGDEIEQLDAYCAGKFIDLVPNQNSFGHMERWLVHPRYADLAEVPWTDDDRATGRAPGYRSLCPVDPRSLAFVAGLYDALLPHFRSRYFNVGLDETVDLGKGRSRDACAARGEGRVYLDFLQAIHALCRERGRTMMFWGDVILSHPELIQELPREAIALDWGYEADHPFDDEGRRFRGAGIPHYVCPGTSTWLSVGGRIRNAMENIRRAARAGRDHGAIGLLVTDWGDLGHWQPLPISYLPWTHAAQQMWSGSTFPDEDVAAATDLHVFRDAAATAADAARALGEAGDATGVTPKNASALGLLLLFPDRPLDRGSLAGLDLAGLERAEARVTEGIARLRAVSASGPDGSLLVDELRLAARLLLHACRLGRVRLEAPGHVVDAASARERAELAHELAGIAEDYRRIWLLRNRPGGLDDSAGRMESLLRRYRTITAPQSSWSSGS